MNRSILGLLIALLVSTAFAPSKSEDAFNNHSIVAPIDDNIVNQFVPIAWRSVQVETVCTPWQMHPVKYEECRTCQKWSCSPTCLPVGDAVEECRPLPE